MTLASPSRAALAPSAALAAPLRKVPRRSLAPLAISRPKARALGGFFRTQSPSFRSPSSTSSFTSAPRASPSDARDALSSSLRADEQAALDAFLASGGDDARARALMVEAATTKNVDGDLLLGALAHLLSRGDAASRSDPLTGADVDGSWELPWASIAPLKAWRYIPVPEFFDVALGGQQQLVGLRSNVLALHFEFQGPLRPGGWDAANQAITFRFTRQKVGIGGTDGALLVDRELASSKGDRVYRFFGFQKGEGVVGARSSGGPLVLLRKVSSSR